MRALQPLACIKCSNQYQQKEQQPTRLTSEGGVSQPFHKWRLSVLQWITSWVCETEAKAQHTSEQSSCRLHEDLRGEVGKENSFSARKCSFHKVELKRSNAHFSPLEQKTQQALFSSWGLSTEAHKWWQPSKDQAPRTFTLLSQGHPKGLKHWQEEPGMLWVKCA